MNTANLQLAGLLLAITSLLDLLKRKGAVTQEEIEGALDEAERMAGDDSNPDLRPANLDAVYFPIRFLREAIAQPSGPRSFFEIATKVGKDKV